MPLHVRIYKTVQSKFVMDRPKRAGLTGYLFLL